MSLNHFELLGNLGQGAFGEVLLVRKIDNKQEYALKVVNKAFLNKERKQYQVYMEKAALVSLNHVGLIKLNFSFQDTGSLYFGLDYVDGGDFAQYIKLNFKNIQKDNYIIKFYMAEIILTLEYIHSKGIAHRDLKPENIMLTSKGHIKIIDFGTASIVDQKKATPELWHAEMQKHKNLDKSSKEHQSADNNQETEIQDYRNRQSSFVGTAEYVSPELLEEDKCGMESDLWALGIILYKLYTSKTPFQDETQYLVF